MKSIPNLPADHDARLKRTLLALDGLSVGDAFGDCFFGSDQVIIERIAHRIAPPPPWSYSDDTVMALSIYRCLEAFGHIDQNHLANSFASEYRMAPDRGYGGTAHGILQAIGAGTPWQEAAGSVFSGMGSMGNGGGMRAAPVGAYFADDIPALIDEARKSAEVTHAHPEGKTGAIAIALAAAWAWNHREYPTGEPAREMIEFVLAHLPDCETGARLRRSLNIAWTTTPLVVGHKIGNGSLVTAPDTVPLAIWCAARHCWNYPDALWAVVSAFGDVDTTCAMVGSIVALSAGRESIPLDWLSAREPLPL